MKQTIETIQQQLSISIDISDYFNPFSKKLKSVSSYKVLELQDMANSFTIEITKIHNGKIKKKTKKELYDEIILYMN